jgi:peptidoglycan/LPS O-acetylase OafA/YrhL
MKAQINPGLSLSLDDKRGSRHSGHLYAVVLIGLIIGAAAVSYEFIEKPILRLKDRLGARRMPVAVAAE